MFPVAEYLKVTIFNGNCRKSRQNLIGTRDYKITKIIIRQIMNFENY